MNPERGNIPLKENAMSFDEEMGVTEVDEVGLLNEKIEPKKEMVLMHSLEERKAELLDWVGVSFGLTAQLLSFWNKCGYK